MSRPLLAVAAAVALSTFFFTSDAQAQYGDTCSDTCQVYDSCDTPCQQCVIFGYDYCEQYQESTCGQGGGQCGGCAVTNRYTTTERYKYGPQDGGYEHCIARKYWYDVENFSRYHRYITQVITRKWETTTCNGVSTTREVSSTGVLGECFQFITGACYPNQPHYVGYVNGKECYW